MTDGEHETNSTVDEAPAYIRAIELHREHPVVKHWFHQITPCELLIPGQGSAMFLMIEFRDGNLAAMVWGDGQGNWGTGGWRPLSAKRVEAESGTGPILLNWAAPPTSERSSPGRGILISSHLSRATRGTIGRL
ncbi:MAG: hypothetical protein ACXWO3_18115 [Isosphaeraceae bacterium]